MAFGVPGNIQHRECYSQITWRYGIAGVDTLCQAWDIFFFRANYRAIKKIHQARYAAGVVGMMMRNQYSGKTQILLVEYIDNRFSVAGIDNNAVFQIVNQPYVVICECWNCDYLGAVTIVDCHSLNEDFV